MGSVNEFMGQVGQNIVKFGWHATGVGRTINEPEDYPTFVYSTGFYLIDKHPEMIVAGLGMEIGHSVLWEFYEKIKEGTRYKDGELVHGMLANGVPVKLKAVPTPGRPLNVARAFHHLESVPALQIVWPDPENRFPGDPGFEEQYGPMQDLSIVIRIDEEQAERDDDDPAVDAWQKAMREYLGRQNTP